VNTFVAGFVGSPAMNLVPVQVVSAGGAVALQAADGWTYPLNDRNGRKALAASTGEVVLGARHSTVRLHHGEVHGSIPANVYTIEPTGDITYVHVRLGSSIVIVSVAPTVRLAPDDKVWVEFDQDKLHLFDGQTEKALRAN